MTYYARWNSLEHDPVIQAEDRKGQHSIRINDQFRLCFVWTAAGPEGVEIVDYH